MEKVDEIKKLSFLPLPVSFDLFSSMPVERNDPIFTVHSRCNV